MKKIVLLRHGQSAWNLENRFTGWTDVDLTPQGMQEAALAGELMKKEGFMFDKAYTSYLKRAVKTLDIALDKMDESWIPVEKSWRLNEKHYGSLQGLNKAETAKQYGEEKVLLWRRSYDAPPAPLKEDDPRSPRLDPRYKNVPPAQLPLTESLKTAIERLLPYWQNVILPQLKDAQTRQLLIVAHGNSLRGIVKVLKKISDADIVGLNLPTGVPYVFEFDQNYNVTKDYFLGDADAVKKQQQAVAGQAKR
ncbi:MAG: 2,3-diphosphoglycerate-dependent phosphoglycerate mutase [Elusimicrobiota bacterium]|jgi:2,3-bisphosphoglycerate-dependent phosphoglycerate mutase|nr:2,3-diphosphoglycerate-dependent phosphoglycerate mutase [Elusimicrobiota bacterium]